MAPGATAAASGAGVSIAAVLLLAASGCASRPRAADSAGSEPSTIQVWGSRGTGGGEFFEPRAIAVAPNGFAYLVDSSGRIQKWSRAGKYLRSWGGVGRGVGQLANPWGLNVDEAKNVYVADTQNHRVQKFRFD